MNATASSDPFRALSIEVQGTVQGVGFRPFLFRLADELGLSGHIGNTSRGVTLEIEGPYSRLEEFRARLRREAPKHARISSVRVAPILPRGEVGLSIDAGLSNRKAAGSGALSLVPDLAPCGQCLSEVFAPGNRRYQYPFTSCSVCGPRYSVLYGVPYERESTAYRDFPLCSDCRKEYDDPRDRRFHAESISCSQCGPKMALADASGRELAREGKAIQKAVRALLRGKIVALKGVGGFQLLGDATNGAAVQTIRDRKHRPTKPLALLFSNVEEVRRACVVSELEEESLLGPEAPIVLLPRRPGAGLANEHVAPGNQRLGVMLPASPLHALLAQQVNRPLVATSGNRSGEPLCITNEEAQERLGAIADVFLVHERNIVRPLDDSVLFFAGGQRVLVRRARGFAPLPCFPQVMAAGADRHKSNETPCEKPSPCVLALGAHLKSTVALQTREWSHCSAHIGDLDTPMALAELRARAREIQAHSDDSIQAIACDLHPDYASTREAFRIGRKENRPVYAVQHHHAHAMAVIAEHGRRTECLVATWDGAGVGPDGTLWGGEFLLTDPKRGRAVRVASLVPFSLPGGSAAFADVRRAGLGLLVAADLIAAAPLLSLSEMELRTWQSQIRDSRTSRTSSVGRLFDAVAALLGLCQRTTFEGEAAMLLQSAAEQSEDTGTFPFPLTSHESSSSDALHPTLLAPAASGRVGSAEQGKPQTSVLSLDWRPMLREMCRNLQAGASRAVLARQFHNTMAGALIDVAALLGQRTLALAGGCFQNALLIDLSAKKARESDIELLFPGALPPGDGGIAPGQAAVVASYLSEGGF